MFETFTKPGLKNFIILLLTWYILITLYTLTASNSNSLPEWLLYYSKFLWPNFVLSYTIFIYVIPYFLERKQYLKLTYAVLVTMLIFVGIRYLNNIFWVPDYYVDIISAKAHFWARTFTIFINEFIKAFQFTAVPFAIRIFFEWKDNEEHVNRLETEKLRTELNTLRYQLNPHFLLNAMNNIYFLALIESQQTSMAVMKLSELFRYMLYEKSDLITLKKEIDYLIAYIEFHKIRYPDDHIELDVRFTEIEKLIQIPPLLFVIFLENAFKHGKSGEMGHPTKISISIENGLLSYQVTNFVEARKEKFHPHGIGLENLKKRLHLLYGNNYTVTTLIKDNTFFSKMKIPINYDYCNRN